MYTKSFFYSIFLCFFCWASSAHAAFDQFRGVKLNSNISSLSNMDYIETLKGPKAIRVYKKNDENLSIGDVKINKIEYYFFEDILYYMTIYVTGSSNSNLFKISVFEKYGQGEQHKFFKNIYSWSDKVAKIRYREVTNPTGAELTFISKDIENEFDEKEKKKKTDELRRAIGAAKTGF